MSVVMPSILMRNLAFWQGLLELLDAVGGDIAVGEVQLLQLAQLAEPIQPGVGNVRV